jgi:hypothetical protein
MNINNFCNNILKYIFDYFSFEELLQIYLTNKYFYQQKDIIKLNKKYSNIYLSDKNFKNIIDYSKK